MCFQSVGQYITLEGRQFKNGNDDFYPLVCNYSFLIAYNDDANPDYYLTCKTPCFGEDFLKPIFENHILRLTMS